MEKSLDQYFTAILGVEDSNPAEYSGLALAYIGDSVFDLLVKTVLVSRITSRHSNIIKKLFIS